MNLPIREAYVIRSDFGSFLLVLRLRVLDRRLGQDTASDLEVFNLKFFSFFFKFVFIFNFCYIFNYKKKKCLLG